MKCLSRMTGNCHVRFLGGKAVVTPLTQPINGMARCICVESSPEGSPASLHKKAPCRFRGRALFPMVDEAL